MTKRERLEDLGIINEKLKRVLNADLFEDISDTKHNYEPWAKRLGIEDPSKYENLESHHFSLRRIKNDLYEILAVSAGDYE